MAYHELVGACEAISASIGPAELIPHFETGRPCLSFKALLRFDWSLLSESPRLRDMGALGTHLLGDWIESLEAWAAAYALEPEAELLISLAEGFPGAPPEVRLLRPVLESGSGGVVNGFFLGVPELLAAGWSPGTPLVAALQTVRESLPARGARAALCGGGGGGGGAPPLYNVQAYSASRARATALGCAAARAAYAHRSAAEGEFHFFSSAFASRFLGFDCPPGFDASGKMLLPMAALERVMRVELSEGLPGGGGGGGGGGSGGSAGAAAPGRRSVASLMRVDDADATTSESAMVFGIDSALGFTAFAGVREFTAPEPDMAIVPPEVLTNLGAAEGARLRVSAAASGWGERSEPPKQACGGASEASPEASVASVSEVARGN